MSPPGDPTMKSGNAIQMMRRRGIAHTNYTSSMVLGTYTVKRHYVIALDEKDATVDKALRIKLKEGAKHVKMGFLEPADQFTLARETKIDVIGHGESNATTNISERVEDFTGESLGDAIGKHIIVGSVDPIKLEVNIIACNAAGLAGAFEKYMKIQLKSRNIWIPTIVVKAYRNTVSVGDDEIYDKNPGRSETVSKGLDIVDGIGQMLLEVWKFSEKLKRLGPASSKDDKDWFIDYVPAWKVREKDKRTTYFEGIMSGFRIRYEKMYEIVRISVQLGDTAGKDLKDIKNSLPVFVQELEREHMKFYRLTKGSRKAIK